MKTLGILVGLQKSDFTYLGKSQYPRTL